MSADAPIVHGESATKRGGRQSSPGLTAKQVRIRTTGIGGSEIGTVLGVNPYKSAIQLFHEKLGLYSEQLNSMPAFMGNFLEDKIADLWQYWEGSPESVLRNFKAKRIVRICRRPKETIRHAQYTWMLANLDREILGERPGVLDCKMLSDYAARQWESGIPASYVFQMQQYMLCHEPYSELAVLRNGNMLEVVPIEPDRLLQERIITEGTLFWNRIEAARDLAWQYLKEEAKDNPNRDKLQDLSGMINRHAPPVDAHPAFEEYIRKRHQDPAGVIQGNGDQYNLMVDYVNAKSIVEQATEEMQLAKNRLVDVLAEKEIITWEDGSKVTFKPSKTGSRTLRVNYSQG